MNEQSLRPVSGQVLVDRPVESILRIRLNRPDALNAIDAAMVADLSKAFDDTTARAILLCSSDRRSFSAGADTKLPDEQRAKVSDHLYALYEKMVSHPAPIIAAIPGHAIGAGAQLAIASDLRVGTPTTAFRFVGPLFGLAAGGWGLPSLIGRGRAMDLCLTARIVRADEALAIGLLDRVLDDADEVAYEIATHIVGLQSNAVTRLKKIINAPRQDGPLATERQGNRDSWTGSTTTTVT